MSKKIGNKVTLLPVELSHFIGNLGEALVKKYLEGRGFGVISSKLAS